jgi:hypothetical protein
MHIYISIRIYGVSAGNDFDARVFSMFP